MQRIMITCAFTLGDFRNTISLNINNAYNINNNFNNNNSKIPRLKMSVQIGFLSLPTFQNCAIVHEIPTRWQ